MWRIVKTIINPVRNMISFLLKHFSLMKLNHKKVSLQYTESILIVYWNILIISWSILTLNSGTACRGCSLRHTRSTPIPEYYYNRENIQWNLYSGQPWDKCVSRIQGCTHFRVSSIEGFHCTCNYNNTHNYSTLSIKWRMLVFR